MSYTRATEQTIYFIGMTTGQSVYRGIWKPGLLPGSGAYQAPNSSTTSASFYCGSYLSMIAEWVAMRPSISSVDSSTCAYSASPKPTDLYDAGHRTTV